MGLFDQFGLWKAKLTGNESKVREAEKRLLVGRAEEAEKKGQLGEAVDFLVQADELLRAAHLAGRARDFARSAEIFAQAKRPLDAARAYEQAKDFAQAGRLFDQAGDMPAAERCLKQAPKKSLLEFYVRRQRWTDAGRLAEAEGDPETAAQHFEKGGDLDSGERCWRAARKLLSAAEMLERHGRISKAAKIYEDAGIPSKAAEGYAKASDHANAARLFGELATHSLAGARTAPHKLQQEAQAQARRAAEHTLAAGDAAGASAWFLKAGDPGRAAECLLASDPAKAAKIHEEQGDLDRAADAWEKAGDVERAGLFRARASDPARAAQILLTQGKHLEAGEIFQKLRRPREAAEAYRTAGRFSQAAELFQGEKDLVTAAECFEQAGLFGRAEPLYKQAGHDAGYVRLLLRRSDFLGAAKVFIRRHEIDRAIHALQQLPPGPEADGLLAHCFRSRGMVDQALLKYEEAVKGRPVARENVGLHYELARLLEEKGQAGRATEIYSSILAVQLDYGDVLDRLGKLKSSAPTRVLPTLPDRYELRSELDRGGEATVYLAHDKLLDRKVALKFIAAAGSRGSMAEARNIASLSHPNIVTLHEIHEHAQGVVLVLEYLEGETLRQRVERAGPLPAPEVARIGRDVCAALQFAHERKLVHRDIKPANVMLLASGAVKVLDFGMARSFENAELSSTLCGTPLFMAPEQILCRPPDARTDLYGLGVTLYFALTGQTPFKGEDVFFQHLHCLPASPRILAPATPEPLEALVLRCLAKEPGERPPSASEVAAELSNC